MMKYILLRETWQHMGAQSGFDPLFAELQQMWGDHALSLYAHQFEKPISNNRLNRLFGKPKISIRGALTPFVQIKHERMAQMAIAHLRKEPDSIVLLSVTENQLSPAFSNLPESMLNRLVLFVHQPPAWFKLNWSDFSVFKKVKSIVGLSTAQVEFFKKITAKPVYKIHHGVDLDFFKPDPSGIKSSHQLIFVGQWMRDFDVLSKSMMLLLPLMSNLTLHCVIQRKFRNHPALYQLALFDNVVWHDDIHSADLLSLYQTSDALYLPLIDSTANNALNEAMACGLPIITTDVGGVSDYLQGHAFILAKVGDAADHARAVTSFFDNIQAYASLSRDIRNHAESYLSWKKQAELLLPHLSS